MHDALLFAAGVALAWLCLRDRPGRTVYVVPALTPRNGWPVAARFGVPDRPLTDWLPDPAVTADLTAWGTSLDGLPWRSAMQPLRVLDVVTDPDEPADLPRLAPPPPRVPEALAHACLRTSTEMPAVAMQGAA